VTPEGLVKKKVKKILDAHGVYYFPPATGGFGRSGVPDLVGCYRGRFIAIECKAGSNTPTALQLRELDCINAAGGIALWVNEETLHRVEAILGEVK
jgi:hypothetical protein